MSDYYAAEPQDAALSFIALWANNRSGKGFAVHAGLRT